MTAVTPMMAQWNECKEKAKDALLLFRLGDFYEAFYKDAEVISKKLHLTLTQRQQIPMCGVPFHTAETYIDKLVAQGFKVAIAEQMEDPSESKGLVKREIVRIVTPGTLLSSQLLKDKKNNFFASIVQIGSTFGLSYLDLSTSEFIAIELDDVQSLSDHLYRIQPKELLTSKKFQQMHSCLFQELSHSFTFLHNEKTPLDLRTSQEVLLCQFQITHLDCFGLRAKPAATCAAGSLLLYLKEEIDVDCDHILHLKTESSSDYMSLDRASLRNLELIEAIERETSKNTLYHILDHTLTPMGARLLVKWIQYPLLSCSEIISRQEAIQTFLEHPKEFALLRNTLEPIRDLERLSMKMSTGFGSPRDMLSLGISLSYLPKLAEILLSFYPSKVFSLLDQVMPLSEKILSQLNETPPLRVGEGNIFKDKVHEELDLLRKISKDSVSYLANYQQSLRERTGIKTLKVGYTKAFGYYIEISRGQSEKAPPDFQRKQTLVNAERFITEELKEYEVKALTADAKSKHLEAELFENLRIKASSLCKTISEISKEVAKLDCLLSLSFVAKHKGWVRPLVDESNQLLIEEGRHPIVENVVGKSHFIANDTFLNDQEQMMLITGPNMAGKSTYIRQVALIVILTQLGSYVPAKKAHIGLIDKVFSRIGASDDLARGQSTFMVEMSETANILHHATARSLILLDEIGRGTSTYDGISIAWAVAEYLLTTSRKQAKTLFATHYWELTKLAEEFPHAVNFRIAVEETSSDIVFLRKIIRGSTDKSYGIHVAKLAGIPAKAIRKAEEMLKKLEVSQPKKSRDQQLTLFEPQKTPHPILQEVQSLNPNELTPLQALEKISIWNKTLIDCKKA